LLLPRGHVRVNSKGREGIAKIARIAKSAKIENQKAKDMDKNVVAFATWACTR
jgi:hypothetical protein